MLKPGDNSAYRKQRRKEVKTTQTIYPDENMIGGTKPGALGIMKEEFDVDMCFKQKQTVDRK